MWQIATFHKKAIMYRYACIWTDRDNSNKALILHSVKKLFLSSGNSAFHK